MGSNSNEVKNKNLSALVVDDCKLQRLIHMELLKSLGISAVEAKNGKEAVDICQAINSFDLILMDKEMPTMDGLKATKMLREMGNTSVIVGVTACSEEKGKQLFMEAGINDYCEKPLARAKLISILQGINKKV